MPRGKSAAVGPGAAIAHRPRHGKSQYRSLAVSERASRLRALNKSARRSPAAELGGTDRRNECASAVKGVRDRSRAASLGVRDQVVGGTVEALVRSAATGKVAMRTVNGTGS